MAAAISAQQNIKKIELEALWLVCFQGNHLCFHLFKKQNQAQNTKMLSELRGIMG